MNKKMSSPNGVEATHTHQDEFTPIFRRLQGDSQNTKILKHLVDGHSITQREAIELFGTYRLASRVHNLREAGANIVTWMEDNESGKGQHARYYLEREE